jgi:hypothetical protein
MVRTNRIKSISILAFVHEGRKCYTAQVTLDNGKTKNLAIADPDSFAFNLEAELEKQGGRFSSEKINIE